MLFLLLSDVTQGYDRSHKSIALSRPAKLPLKLWIFLNFHFQSDPYKDLDIKLFLIDDPTELSRNKMWQTDSTDQIGSGIV